MTRPGSSMHMPGSLLSPETQHHPQVCPGSHREVTKRALRPSRMADLYSMRR